METVPPQSSWSDDVRGPGTAGGRGRRARAAYAHAVSEYAALGRDELREVARAVMAVTSGRG
ncbi:hypothetical protein [Actinacidiphila soli]|uniref:hypothetical protein n=1 Tax=Actinacidiphila soli TaxID=2487275 RepID=UPI000FC9FC6E|nr:hypothetical protein [Actinacidiphila soli]